MNSFGLLSVAEKNPPSESPCSRSPAFDSKLAVVLYPVHDLHCRAMSRTVDEFEVDWENSVEGARVQMLSMMNDIPVTDEDIIPISQMLDEMSSANEHLSFFHRMIPASAAAAISSRIAPCRASATSSSPSSLETFRNIGCLRAQKIVKCPALAPASLPWVLATSSLGLLSTFVRSCRTRAFSLALEYSTSAALYKASRGNKFCTGLLAFRKRLLCKEVQDFDSYRSKFSNAVFAPLREVRSAALAANRTPLDVLIDVLMTGVPVSGFEELGNVQDPIDRAMQTTPRSKKDTEKATQTPLGHLCLLLGTVVDEGAPEKTRDSSSSAATAFFALFSPPFLQCFFMLLFKLSS